MREIIGIFIGCAAMLASFAAHAQTADCSRAKSDIEKVICADSRAGAADKAMAAAYNALHEKLQGADREALLRSQRNWIKRRGADCDTQTAGSPACIAEDADRRRFFLEARAESGPGVAADLKPVLVVRPGHKGAYEIDVELLRFVDPKAPGERTFNAAIDKLLADIPTDKDADPDHTYSHYAWVRIAYASPRLLSARFEGYDFTGGAHGMSPSWGLSIDMQSGRKLAFAEAFDKAAHEKLDQDCLQQVLVQKKDRAGELPPANELADMRKAMSKGVGDFGNWNFSGKGADVVFNQYELGSYAEGRYSCTFTLALLKSLATAGFPLPE